jgi:hypothetical protein
MTLNGVGRTNLQAGCILTLQTGHGKDGSLIHIYMNPNIRIFAFEATGFLE